ncbi:12168_t:CDS:2 [Entrophospora sp. SA101]|nr:12168_t:CDS:2 [Entrophospora sp. SA101]
MEIDANATNALQTFATSTNASIINTKETISPHSIEDSSNTFNDNGNSGSSVEDNKMTQEWVVVNKYTNFQAAILIDQIPSKNNINKKKFVEKFLINYKGFVGLYITRFGKQRKFVANFDNEEDLNNLVVTDLPDYEAELMAIMTALITLPRYSFMSIYTDNQSPTQLLDNNTQHIQKL